MFLGIKVSIFRKSKVFFCTKEVKTKNFFKVLFLIIISLYCCFFYCSYMRGCKVVYLCFIKLYFYFMCNNIFIVAIGDSQYMAGASFNEAGHLAIGFFHYMGGCKGCNSVFHKRSKLNQNC